jgi:hypothetical protein
MLPRGRLRNFWDIEVNGVATTNIQDLPAREYNA